MSDKPKYWAAHTIGLLEGRKAYIMARDDITGDKMSYANIADKQPQFILYGPGGSFPNPRNSCSSRKDRYTNGGAIMHAIAWQRDRAGPWTRAGPLGREADRGGAARQGCGAGRGRVVGPRGRTRARDEVEVDVSIDPEISGGVAGRGGAAWRGVAAERGCKRARPEPFRS